MGVEEICRRGSIASFKKDRATTAQESTRPRVSPTAGGIVAQDLRPSSSASGTFDGFMEELRNARNLVEFRDAGLGQSRSNTAYWHYANMNEDLQHLQKLLHEDPQLAREKLRGGTRRYYEDELRKCRRVGGELRSAQKSFGNLQPFDGVPMRR